LTDIRKNKELNILWINDIKVWPNDSVGQAYSFIERGMLPMMRRTVKEVAEMISIKNDYHPFAEQLIQGVCIDTRKLEKGNLFVPFIGEKVDGHQFVEQAIQQGATAALWEKKVPNPPTHLPILIVENTLEALQQLSARYLDQLQVKVIGITGSNGKTTTKDMVANLLSLQYKVQKTEGNYNNHIGLPFTILQLEEDTEMAVLEMGMSGFGEIDFLSRLAKPDAVIITNIGESHLLDLGSREGIAQAKLEILNGLKEDGKIIYFGDEPLLKNRLANYQGKAEILSFGKGKNNTLYPTEITSSDHGSYFRINQHEDEYYLPVLGTHNIMNALSAMLVANQFGVPFASFNDGFKTLRLTNMRMELVEGANGVKIINDAYNASPTSMKAAIELVSTLQGYEHKVLVLGDMLELGPDEIQFHYNIGQSLNPSQIDYVFTFGELGKEIARGASEVLSEDRVFAFINKEELVEELKKKTDSNTLVLVKASRGMKLEDVVTGLR
jgi:UDP-N-acetylmuramoyl-tripeptide--D-alanyl-D-alanine ligase